MRRKQGARHTGMGVIVTTYLTTMLPRLIRAKARKQYRVCAPFCSKYYCEVCVLYCLLRAIMPMVREKKWQKLKADLT